MDEYERYLRQQIARLIALGLDERADKLRNQLSKYLENEKLHVELEKRLNALPPSKFITLVKRSVELSKKFRNIIERMKDDELRLLLLITFHEYEDANSDVQQEFMTLAELKQMDLLENMIQKD